MERRRFDWNRFDRALDAAMILMWPAWFGMIAVIVILAALAGCTPQTHPPIAHIQRSTFACQSQAFGDRVIRLYTTAPDRSLDLLRRALGNGQCIDVDSGDVVYIVRSTLTMRLIRPPAAVTAYWIDAESVGP